MKLSIQGQRAAYPAPGVNSGPVPGQYGGQLAGNHLAQQQPYNGQTIGQFSPGMQGSQMQSPQQVQNGQGHANPGMLSPNSQIASQPMQQNTHAVQGHYGIVGQGHNMNLQQRQGLGQLSSQMQGQYSSPVQNGPTSQLHPGKNTLQAATETLECSIVTIMYRLLSLQSILQTATHFAFPTPNHSFQWYLYILLQ